MAKGTIKWFNKDQGFGFIMPDEGGRDLFFQTLNIEAFEEQNLSDGQRVEYEFSIGKKGPEAIKVRPL